MVDVYISPGHGRRPDGSMDPGASDGHGNTEQSEGDTIARIVEHHLLSYGLSVHRQPRGGPNFPGTITEINSLSPKVAITLHHDWSKAPRGGFGFYGSKSGKGLANHIHAAYKRHDLPTRPHMTTLPGKNVGPAVVTRTIPVTVLWEVDRIGTAIPHSLYALTIAEGIATYLGVDPTPPLPDEEDPSMPLTDDDISRIAQATAAEVAFVLGWHDSDRPGAPVRGYDNDISRIRRTMRKMAQHMNLPSDDIEV